MRQFIPWVLLVLWFAAVLLASVMCSEGAHAGLVDHLALCSKKTCSEATGESGPVIALTSSVVWLAPSNDCPQTCTSVRFIFGKAHVMGHWRTLACRIWGGNRCKFQEP